jgi:hypothetical protein
MFIFTCSYRGVLHIENVRESYNSTIVYSNSEKQTEIARRETSTSPLASLIVFTRCVPADYPQRQSQCPKTRVVREYRELLLSHLHRKFPTRLIFPRARVARTRPQFCRKIQAKRGQRSARLMDRVTRTILCARIFLREENFYRENQHLVFSCFLIGSYESIMPAVKSVA